MLLMKAMPTASFPGRYGVPVFIAAAFHVVLLFAFNPVGRTGHIEVSLPLVKLPPFPPEPIVPVAATDPVATTEPVRTLNPGPVRPVSEDRSVNAAAEINMGPPMATPQVGVRVELQRIPGGGFGEDDSGPATAGPVGAPVFMLDQLDRIPRARLQPSPDYPLALRQAGMEGQVLVEFSVDIAGRVVTAKAVQATHREFEVAAVRAVLKWRFEPGRREGRPVPFRMVAPIRFSLGAD
ncbi:MAG: hypothetical protein C0502_03810 [Opitutus sp.]|nr:hypothetical protein [Opitutus sp.]